MKLVRYVSSYGILDAVAVILSYILACVGLRNDKNEYNSNILYFDSASSALYKFLMHFGKNGNVVLPAYTCMEVVWAVKKSGCTPIFIDVDKSTGLMDVDNLIDLIHNKITDISVIIATHIYGVPCKIDVIVDIARSNNIILVEDCAQAWNSGYKFKRLGEWGDVAIFSTGRGKTIDLGGGGYLAINNMKFGLEEFNCRSGKIYLSLKDIIKIFFGCHQIWSVIYGNILKIKYLYFRTWFWDSIESTSESSRNLNSRSCPLIYMRRLLVERADLNKIVHDRISKASVYYKNLRIDDNKYLVSLFNFHDQTICPHSYPILVANREKLFLHLRKLGYDCPTGFTYSAGNVIDGKIFTGSEYFSERILLLPLHSKIQNRDIINICLIINKFFESNIDD